MTLYPDGIDSTLQLPDVPGSDGYVIAINAIKDAIIAVEIELGLDPAGIYSDVATRLSVLEGRVGPGATITGGPIDINDANLTGVLDVIRGGTGLNLASAMANPNAALISTGLPTPGIAYSLISDVNIDPAAAIDVTKLAAGTNTYVLTTNAGTPAWMPAGSGTFTAGGDLSGTLTSQKVIAIQNVPVNATTPNDDYVLTYSLADGYWHPAAAGSSIEYDITRFGAVGDGITDDTTAIQTAINAIALDPGATIDQITGARRIVFPNNGVYACAGRLLFDYKQAIYFKGPANLHFTGDGYQPFLQLLGCGLWIFEDIHFTYSNAAFTGAIVETGRGILHSNDSAEFTFNRCSFYGTDDVIGNHHARSGLSLKNVINVRVHDCTFTACLIGIDGHDNLLGYANSILIDGCTFHKLGDGVPVANAPAPRTCASIRNPGEAWSIINCTFEPLQTSSGGFASQNAILQDLDYDSLGTTIIGNWMGDGDGYGPWVTLRGHGTNLSGNLVANGSTALRFGGCNGLSITGNRVGGNIDFVLDDSAHTSAGVFIAGNFGASYTGLNNVGGISFLANSDSHGQSIQLPITIGDDSYSATYTRIILSTTKTWNPSTVNAGAFAESDDIIWTGSHLGAVLAFGVTPTPPAGVLVDAKMHTDGNVRASIYNMSGTNYTPGTLTFKFHMWE